MYTQKSIPFNKSEVHYSIQKSSEKGVVFYHGDGQNHTAGNSILELFPDQYTKVSIDRPGHGKSPFLTGRTIEKECEILETIVGKEGIKDPVVIGHSSGAVIAASFAMRNKLQALILLNPFFMNPRKLFWYLPASLLEKMYLNQAKGKHNPNAPYHIFGHGPSVKLADEIKKIYVEMLGPLGIKQFEKVKDTFEENEIIEQIHELQSKNIISKKEAKQFEDRIHHLLEKLKG